MSKAWVRIYTSNDFYKAELVRHVLIGNEIEAVLVNRQGYPYQFGEVEVHIHESDFQRALEIIISNEL